MAGKTLLPGLIDMHVHLDSPADIGGYSGLEFTDSFWTAVGVGNARDMLEAGFTTVRNVGSSNYNDVGLKQAIDDGYAVGPRIVPAGYALGATGGHCDSTDLPPSLKKPPRRQAIGDGAEEVRYQVRRQRKFGAEVIKVCATGGVFSRNTEPGQQQLPRPSFARSPRRRTVGPGVAAHAHGADGHQGRDPGRHRHDRACQPGRRRGHQPAPSAARPRGSPWISTTPTTPRPRARRTACSRRICARTARSAEIQRENFRKAHRAGVKMVFGTDAGVMPHGTGGRQFAHMVEYGMTPMRSDPAATLNAAQALGREGDVGAIAVGRLGDMVAVTGDPLADVRLLENADAVIKGGQMIGAAIPAKG